MVPDAPIVSVAERIAATEEWLKKTPANRFFIQLLNLEAPATAEVEAFLQTHAGKLDSGQLRVYRSKLSGKDRIGVIYGEYSSRDEAITALAQLPPEIRATQLYVRSISKLR